MFAKKEIWILQQLINEVWANRELLKNETYTDAVKNVIEKVDEGILRTAVPVRRWMAGK